MKTPATTIETLAAKLQEKEQSETEKKETDQRQEYFHAMIRLRNYFEENFKDVLFLLSEAGITYTAHRQNLKYAFMGSYIKFDLKGKTLKMDIEENAGWRYEYVPHRSDHYTMAFGNWPMDKFIIWITNNLISAK